MSQIRGRASDPQHTGEGCWALGKAQVRIAVLTFRTTSPGGWSSPIPRVPGAEVESTRLEGKGITAGPR